MIIFINIIIGKNYELFKNGGMIHDLFMVGVGRLCFEFIVLFLLDFNFYFKKLRNYLLTKEIEKKPYNNKISQYEYNKSFEGYDEALSIRFVRIILPISNAFFFQMICPFFYCLSFLHILIGCFITRWSLLYRSKKPDNIMNSKYSKRVIRLISYIFTLQGFGVLLFDIFFEDLEILTFIILAVSLIQLIDVKKLFRKIKMKLNERKLKKKIQNENSINNPLSEANQPENHFIYDESFLKKDQNISDKKNSENLIDLINNKDILFDDLDVYFLTDYDRENPLTKHVANQEHQNKLILEKVKSNKSIGKITKKDLFMNLKQNIEKKIVGLKYNHNSINPTKSGIWNSLLAKEEVPNPNISKGSMMKKQTDIKRISIERNMKDPHKIQIDNSNKNIPSSQNKTRNLDTPCIY